MKFNLLTFWQRNIKRISLVFGLLSTIAFIFGYFLIPRNEYFDFIVYTLAIAYAFIFFIVSAIESIVTDSASTNYVVLKEKYFYCTHLYTIHSIVVRRCEQILSESDYEYIGDFTMLVETNLRTFHSGDNAKFYIEQKHLNLVKYSKAYIWLEKMLLSIDLTQKKRTYIIFLRIYYLLQRIYSRRFKKSIRSIVKEFGDRVDADLYEQMSTESFQIDMTNKLDYIANEMDELKNELFISNLPEIHSKLDTLEYQINAIESNIDDILLRDQNDEF